MADFSLFYVPVPVAFVVAILTIAHLFACTRLQLSWRAFGWVRVFWFCIVFFGGPAVSIAFYNSAHTRSGDDKLAFVLLFLFLGLIFPVYAGFGFVAYVFPSEWQRFVMRREQVRSQRILEKGKQ